MAFKMVVLFAALACASAAYLEDDHHEAHYSPASAVSYSSFTRHEPTKVANTVTYAEQPSYQYTAPVAKTLTYAQPSVHYSTPVATQTYSYSQPSVQYVHEQPSYTKTLVSQPSVQYVHEQPSYTKTLVSQPSVQYVQQQPTYTKTLVSQPTYAKAYVHQEPAVHYSTPVATQTVSYAQPALHYSTPVTTTYAHHSQPAVQYYQEQPTYAKTLVSGPTTTKHVVSHPPTYASTVVAAPTYAKAYLHQDPTVYAASNTVSYQTPLAYSAPVAKTYVSEPVHTLVQQPSYVKTVTSRPVYATAAPVYATKTVSYAPEAQVSHVSYQDSGSNYSW